MSTAKRVIKNTGFLYAKMGITMFISLYTTRLILNSLGASDFGVFNVVGGAIAMLGFLNAAMASATQRFMSYSEGEGNKEKQKQIFNISFVLHLMIGILLGLILMIAGYFFFNGILNIVPERIFAAKVVYGSLIISAIFTVMSVPYDAVLNARENMLYYSIVGIIESLLKLSVALIIVYYGGDKLILYGILMACIPLITLSIMRIYCHKNYEECSIAPKAYWDKSLMKEMTGFAGWNLLGTGSSMVGNYGNGIVVNHFYGTSINAAVGIANQINGQLMVFSNNMMKALNPVIVKKQGEGNQNTMIHYSLLGSKVSFFLLGLLSIPFITETSFILKFWLKNIPEWTIIFVRFQIIRSLIEQLTITLGTSLSAKGKIKQYNLSIVFTYLFPLIIIYILFKNNFPPYWLYIVAVFFMVLNADIIKVYYNIKFCDLKLIDLIKIVLLPCILSYVLSVAINLVLIDFFQQGFLRFIYACLISAFSFSIFMFLFSNNSEKKMFINVIKHFKNKFSKKIN